MYRVRLHPLLHTPFRPRAIIPIPPTTRKINPTHYFTTTTTTTTAATDNNKMASTMQSQIIYAPSSTPSHPGFKTIFLAGTTSKVSDSIDWREALSTSLSTHAVTIYNPYRSDWDSTWREDINFAPFRQQVEWELDMQEKADVMVVYFHPDTQAPVSLLEFGLCARMAVPGKVTVVCCPDGYWKKGNVEIVCKRFGVEMVTCLEDLKEAVVKKLVPNPGNSL